MDKNMMIFIAVGCAVAVIGTLSLTAKLRREKKILRTEINKAAPLTNESTDGSVVRITGVVRKVATHGTLISPISDTRCVAHRTRVQAMRYGAFPRGAPFEVLRLCRFNLECPDGTSLAIDGTHALFSLPEAIPLKGNSRKLAFLRSLELNYHRVDQVIFEEIVVEVGATITVVGTLAQNLAGPASVSRGYRDGPALTNVLTGNATQPLIFASAPRAAAVN